MKNIVLTGMSGAGKSTLGIQLAAVLHMHFIDTDTLITAREKKPLQMILDEDGIDYFLKTEEEVLCGLSVQNTVISTGGSAVYSEKAMTSLKKDGIIVYLYLPYDILVKRIPNLSTRGIVIRSGSTLKDVYDERLPLYRRYSDITVDRTSESIKDSITTITGIISRG